MTNSIGGRIAELRRKKGVTQDQLAEQMGVSPQAVSKWENDISCPDISLLPELAGFFDSTVDALLRGEQAAAVQIMPVEERKDLNKMLLKISVDSANGDIVRVNLPLSLVKLGLEMGTQMPQVAGNAALQGVDFEAILMAAESGVIGKIIQVESAGGDKVDITIE